MDVKIEGKSVRELRKILEYPPYLIFVFVGALFILVSLFSKNYFDQVWIFFLYSASGMIWRYIIIDFLIKYKEEKREEGQNESDYQKIEEIKRNKKEKVTIIYHIVNVGLLLALFYYLKII